MKKQTNKNEQTKHVDNKLFIGTKQNEIRLKYNV